MIWFKCVGCGKPAAYFDTTAEGNPIGSVAHSKPIERLNMPGIACKFYNESTAEDFWEANKNAERLPPPEDFTSGAN